MDIYIPHRLYFAKESSTWNNTGVAFLSPDQESDPQYHAIVHLWQITEEQFNDVKDRKMVMILKKQDGKKREDWYSLTLKLGERDGLPILTFTGNHEKNQNAPDESYLKVIIDGLCEQDGWTEEMARDYLSKFLPH